MGWTSGGEDLGYTGGIWDEPDTDFGGGGGGAGANYFGGMDTAFGGGGGGGGSQNGNMNWMQPLMTGLGQLGTTLGNNSILQQYGQNMGGPLPQAELGAMNMDQVGAAVARAEQMANELNQLKPSELTLRSAANAAARGASAHGVTGSLAGSMGADAENQATSLWDQWRRQMLLNANQQSADLAVQRQRLLEQNWQRYLADQRQRAALAAAMKKGDLDLAGVFGGAVGAIGMGIMGGNPMQGYQMGNAAGQGMLGGGSSDPYAEVNALPQHYSSSYNPSRGY